MRLESPTTLAPPPTLAPGSAALRAQFPLLQQAIHGAPVVVVAHPALEAGACTGAWVSQARLQRGGIDRRVRYPETCHLSPPRPAG